jgi:hypothetical protein
MSREIRGGTAGPGFFYLKRQCTLSGPRIVAGIDGSESSVSALRWAIRQAALTGAAVDAVIAWHYPDLARSRRQFLVPE